MLYNFIKYSISGIDDCISKNNILAVIFNFHGFSPRVHYPPGATLSQRTLQDFEFVWILRGHATWIYDDIEHPAPTGTLILSQPGFCESYRWDSQRSTQHGFIHFDFRHFPAGLPPLKKWPLLQRIGPENPVIALLGHLAAELHLPGARNSRKSQLSLRLALELFLTGSQSQLNSGMALPSGIRESLNYVASRWKEAGLSSLSLDEMAHAAHISPVHLCRLYRDTLGMSPLRLLRLARLRHGSILLTRTDMNLDAIANFTGFANPFHFSRVFKQMVGLSPDNYRDATLQGSPPPLPPLHHDVESLLMGSPVN